MPKLRHPRIIAGLLSFFVFLWLFDFILWKVDPAGLMTLYYDRYDLQTHALPSPDGQRYIPGVYRLRTYTAVIGLDGFRAVPESRGGPCRIAFVGDSVTFGMGTEKSFVDFLAPDIDATVINAGNPAYNIENVREEMDAVDADGYIYLIFYNDDLPRVTWGIPAGHIPYALPAYVEYWNSDGWLPPNLPMFRRNLAPIVARDDVLAFSFDGVPLSDTVKAEFPAVKLITMYQENVSHVDGHPNLKSTKLIADEMRDEVIPFTRRVCESKSAPSPVPYVASRHSASPGTADESVARGQSGS